MKLIKLPLEHWEDKSALGPEVRATYSHKNFLIRWIFWGRLSAMLKLAKPAKRVLDFGSGSGVLLPSLSESFKEVYALDLELDALRYIKKRYSLSNVKITQGHASKLPYKDNFFDIIFAADVLEHFKDSTAIQKEFRRVLKRGGQLIVSGPTENKFYILGRKLLYKLEKPEDHYTGIPDIIKISKNLFEMEQTIILPTFLTPIFKIYTARNIKD